MCQPIIRMIGIVTAKTFLVPCTNLYFYAFLFRNSADSSKAMMEAHLPIYQPARSLKDWALENSLTYRTAWRMFHEDRLPESIRAEKLPTGTIRIYPKSQADLSQATGVAIYARINPRLSRRFLEMQVEACKSFCFSSGWTVSEVQREIAPGIGHKRRKLAKLLSRPPSRLVVLTQSILSRFDFALLEQAFARSGCTVTVLDQSQEINGAGGALEDIVDAISATCSRHYGVKKGALLIDELKKLL